MVSLIQEMVSCIPYMFLSISRICCVCIASEKQNWAVKVFEQGSATALRWDRSWSDNLSVVPIILL